MKAIQLKNKIIQLLNTDNRDYLKTVLKFAEKEKLNTNENDIVAYTVQGEGMTKSIYVQKVKDAETSVASGNFISVDDLEKEVKNW